jgi:hypothetical protein
MDAAEEYRSLWQPGFDGNVLIRLERSSESSSEEFVIYDLEERNVLLIEDEGTYQEVVRRMIAAGVPILDTFPPNAT